MNWIRKNVSVIMLFVAVLGAGVTYGKTVSELGKIEDVQEALNVYGARLIAVEVPVALDTNRLNRLESDVEKADAKAAKFDEWLRRLELSVVRMETLQGVDQ